MSSIVVVGHLQTVNKSARDKVLDRFRTIAEYSTTQEPEVFQYAITVPRDPTDETTIYAIEEYATLQVSQAHLASFPVQGLIAMFGTDPAVLAAPPKVYQLEYTSDHHHFARAEINKASDPFIVFATARQPSTIETAEVTETWSKIVQLAESHEPKTLMYSLLRDKENLMQIGTIEVYVSQSDFEKHCSSSAVASLVAKNDQIEGEMDFVSLRLVLGWLSR